jgi:hypothetical protein
MLQLIIFFLSCLGATFIINISYIFKPIREKAACISESLGKLLKCPMCMGFWVGLIFRILFMWKNGELNHIQFNDIYNICYGFASSFVCYASYLLLKYFMEKYD